MLRVICVRLGCLYCHLYSPTKFGFVSCAVHQQLAKGEDVEQDRVISSIPAVVST